jgi:hypothetical protein
MDKPSAFTCYIDGNVVKPDFAANTTDLYEAAAIAICFIAETPRYGELAADTPLVIQFADNQQAGGKVMVDEILEWTQTPAAQPFLTGEGAEHEAKLAQLAATLL